MVGISQLEIFLRNGTLHLFFESEIKNLNMEGYMVGCMYLVNFIPVLSNAGFSLYYVQIGLRWLELVYPYYPSVLAYVFVWFSFSFAIVNVEYIDVKTWTISEVNKHS